MRKKIEDEIMANEVEKLKNDEDYKKLVSEEEKLMFRNKLIE